jgi:hypothetical protein
MDALHHVTEPQQCGCLQQAAVSRIMRRVLFALMPLMLLGLHWKHTVDFASGGHKQCQIVLCPQRLCTSQIVT